MGKIFLKIFFCVLLVTSSISLVACNDMETVSENLLYMKNGELCYTTSEAKMSEILTENVHYSEFSEILGYYDVTPVITSTAENQKVFYADKNEQSNWDLFYKNIDHMDKEAVLIDTDVDFFKADDTGSYITYMKDRGLYQTDLNNSELICNDLRWDSYDNLVNRYNGFAANTNRLFISTNGKVIYRDSNDNLFIKNAGDVSEKVDDSVTALLVSDNGNVVSYLKNDTLYRKCDDNPVEVIALDVNDILKVYDSGEIYYLQIDKQIRKYGEFIAENAIIENNINQIQNQNSKEIQENIYSIGFYDNEKNQNVSQNSFLVTTYDTRSIYSLFSFEFAKNTPVMLYRAYYPAKAEKIRTSKNSEPLINLIEKSVLNTAEIHIAVGGVDNKLNHNLGYNKAKEIVDFSLSDDGTSAYVLDNISFYDSLNGTGELYKIIISDKNVQETELYDTDVHFSELSPFYESNIKLVEDDVLYLKNVIDHDMNNFTAELYENQQKIDIYTVNANSYEGNIYYPLVDNSNQIIYITNWDFSESVGTLNIYKNGKISTIAENVKNYSYVSNDSVIYTVYNDIEKRAELYYYKNGNSKMLDYGSNLRLR